jgi:hypothetical protein
MPSRPALSWATMTIRDRSMQDHTRRANEIQSYWWSRWVSNPQPTDCQPVAPPIAPLPRAYEIIFGHPNANPLPVLGWNQAYLAVSPPGDSYWNNVHCLQFRTVDTKRFYLSRIVFVAAINVVTGTEDNCGTIGRDPSSFRLDTTKGAIVINNQVVTLPVSPWYQDTFPGLEQSGHYCGLADIPDLAGVQLRCSPNHFGLC